MKRTALLLLFLAATPSVAQEDPMEMQRCIWSCLADANGPNDPAYGACVSRRCESGSKPRPAATEPARKPKETARTPARTAPQNPWIYGDHPLLGRGAFGYTEQGVVGLACGTSGWPLDLRITNGFFKGAALTVFFDNSITAYSVGAAPGPASQQSGDACTIGLDAFKGASTLYLINGTITSVSNDASGMVITLQGSHQTAAVRNAAQALQALGGAEVALTGSAAAIDQLLAACPVARADAAGGCGD